MARQRVLPRPGSGRRTRPASCSARRPIGNQALCPPQLNYLSFLAQASTESQGPWDSNYQIEDDYSWFLPGKHGDHDMKFGFDNYTALRRVSQVNSNGTFSFNTDLPFDPANPRTYPERFSIRTGDLRRERQEPHLRVLRPGQMARDAADDAEPRRSLRPRVSSRSTRRATRCSPPARRRRSTRTTSRPESRFTHSLDEAGKSVIRGGYGIFYNRTILGAVDDTLEFGKYTSSAVVQFPTNSADPGPSAGRFPTDPYLVNGPFVNRTLLNQSYPARRAGEERRRRDLRLAGSHAAVRASVHFRVMCESSRRRSHSTPTTCGR